MAIVGIWDSQNVGAWPETVTAKTASVHKKGDTMTGETMTRYTVMTAAAKMPASCWGRYGRVAVVELDDTGTRPKMISPRARGIARIVRVWEGLNIGKTDRCAYARAFDEALELAAELNGGAA
jgi:hypothetical protein